MKCAWCLLGCISFFLSLLAGCDDANCRDSLPSGSYAETCKDCSIDCTILSCRCGNGRGSFLETELDISECDPKNDISNYLGALECSGPSCIRNGNACGPSDTFVSACCSEYCGPNGTCE
jgi:hypothetical protein